MRVLLFGATGMVGSGVLRECLAAPDVTAVRAIGRSPIGAPYQGDPKLDEVVWPALMDAPGSLPDTALGGFDACFYCLGMTAAGMSEAAYTHAMYDLPLQLATRLAQLNPRMRFVYVSGAGADSSESGPTMWARVRGRTENALFALPFAGAYALRPGVIQPLNGARSKTTSYRVLYALLAPVLPLLRRVFPGSVLSTEIIGRAMLALAREGGKTRVLEARDIAVVVGVGGG
ncbi:MAG: epimerase [Rhodoferax sp.]|nr:epimerase [Rhodoferax sp.]